MLVESCLGMNQLILGSSFRIGYISQREDIKMIPPNRSVEYIKNICCINAFWSSTNRLIFQGEISYLHTNETLYYIIMKLYYNCPIFH